MRALLGVLVIAACGGTSSTPATLPSNTPPPPQPEAQATPAPPRDTSMCEAKEGFGPITLTAEQAAARYGKDLTKFSAAKTTKETPLEVCGIAKQQEWLMTATCDDGSRPYRDRNQIRDSRRGNVGAGGRCGTIIDVYVSTCPEAAYELHIDMYHCGPNESFM